MVVQVGSSTQQRGDVIENKIMVEEGGWRRASKGDHSSLAFVSFGEKATSLCGRHKHCECPWTPDTVWCGAERPFAVLGAKCWMYYFSTTTWWYL